MTELLNTIRALYSDHFLIPLGRQSKAPQVAKWNTIEQKANLIDLVDEITEKGINIGVRLDNLLVIDVEEEGREPLQELRKQLKFSLDSTYCVKTGSGGFHIYFRNPDNLLTDEKIYNPKTGKPYHKIEIKSTNNRQVVAAGSLHPNGTYYTTLSPYSSIKTLPKELEDYLKLRTNNQSIINDKDVIPNDPLLIPTESETFSLDQIRLYLDILDPKDFRNFDDFIKLMMGFHYTGYNHQNETRQLFIDWSTRDPLYNSKEAINNNIKLFNSLRYDKTNKIGKGTIIKLAQAKPPKRIDTPITNNLIDPPINQKTLDNKKTIGATYDEFYDAFKAIIKDFLKQEYNNNLIYVENQFYSIDDNNIWHYDKEVFTRFSEFVNENSKNYKYIKSKNITGSLNDKLIHVVEKGEGQIKRLNTKRDDLFRKVLTDSTNKPLPEITFKNKIYNFKKNEVRPIETKDYRTTYLNVIYDNYAMPTKIDDLLYSSFNKQDNQISCFYQLLAMMLNPAKHKQLIVILKGGAGTGKSTVVKLINKLLGQLATTINLQDINTNKNPHCYEGLDTKLLITMNELACGYYDSRALKELVEPGFRLINPKGKSQYEAYINLSVLAASNVNIKFNDTSGALDDRIIVIPFNQRFRETGKEVVEYENLILESMEDKSHFINKIIYANKQLLDNNWQLELPVEWIQATNEFIGESNVINSFVKNFLVFNHDADIRIYRSDVIESFLRVYQTKLTNNQMGDLYKAIEQRSRRTSRDRLGHFYDGVTIDMEKVDKAEAEREESKDLAFQAPVKSYNA